MPRVLLCLALLTVALATNEEGKKFLEENSKKEGIITLPSGLQYKVLFSRSTFFVDFFFLLFFE
jgi:hypothetical protein